MELINIYIYIRAFEFNFKVALTSEGKKCI